MKKYMILIAIILGSQISFADEYDSLAQDAVSKLSQVGSKKCADKGSKVQFIDVQSKSVGSHVEAEYILKLNHTTYKVNIVDGLVTSVAIVNLGDAG